MLRHQGGLVTNQFYAGLATRNGVIYAVAQPVRTGADPVKVLAMTEDQGPTFTTDLNVALGSALPMGDLVTSSLAVADDGTVVVTLNASTGFLVSINPTGGIMWTADPRDAAFGYNPSTNLSAPAVAADGTIYVVADFGQASNVPLPQLWAVSRAGVLLWSVDLAVDGDRYNGVPPGVSSPILQADGKVGTLLGGVTSWYQRVTPASHALAARVDLADTGLGVELVLPLADGTLLASGMDLNGQWVMASFSSTGSRRWTTPYNGNGQHSSPVTGAGNDVLVAWGNQNDGEGGGLYVFQRDGSLPGTWGAAYGDGLQALGTTTNDVYVLIQDQALSTTGTPPPSSGPVLYAVDRTTGVPHWHQDLGCSTDSSNLMDASMVVLPNGHVVVSCQQAAENPGGGGIYVLATTVTLPASPWPYPNGGPAATRRMGTQ